MADNNNNDMSDQDRIRARRLAKLGTSQPASNTSSQAQTNRQSNTTPPPEQTKPKINITSSDGSSDGPNRFSQIASPKGLPQATMAKPSSPHRRARSHDGAKSIEEFENGTLSSIFRFTVSPERSTDAQGYVEQHPHNSLCSSVTLDSDASLHSLTL